jgi:hypothetical protein
MRAKRTMRTRYSPNVWGVEATDRCDVGLAALSERNYPKASAQLRKEGTPAVRAE